MSLKYFLFLVLLILLHMSCDNPHYIDPSMYTSLTAECNEKFINTLLDVDYLYFWVDNPTEEIQTITIEIYDSKSLLVETYTVNIPANTTDFQQSWTCDMAEITAFNKGVNWHLKIYDSNGTDILDHPFHVTPQFNVINYYYPGCDLNNLLTSEYLDSFEKIYKDVGIDIVITSRAITSTNQTNDAFETYSEWENYIKRDEFADEENKDSWRIFTLNYKPTGSFYTGKVGWATTADDNLIYTGEDYWQKRAACVVIPYIQEQFDEMLISTDKQTCINKSMVTHVAHELGHLRFGLTDHVTYENYGGFPYETNFEYHLTREDNIGLDDKPTFCVMDYASVRNIAFRDENHVPNSGYNVIFCYLEYPNTNPYVTIPRDECCWYNIYNWLLYIDE